MDEKCTHKNYYGLDDGPFDADDKQDLLNISQNKSNRYCFIASLPNIDRTVLEEDWEENQHFHMMIETLDIFAAGNRQMIIMECSTPCAFLWDW